MVWCIFVCSFCVVANRVESVCITSTEKWWGKSCISFYLNVILGRQQRVRGPPKKKKKDILRHVLFVLHNKW